MKILNSNINKNRSNILITQLDGKVSTIVSLGTFQGLMFLRQY